MQSSEIGVTPQDIFQKFMQSSEIGVTPQDLFQQFMQSSEIGVTRDVKFPEIFPRGKFPFPTPRDANEPLKIIASEIHTYYLVKTCTAML
jgi:hypothetical protein